MGGEGGLGECVVGEGGEGTTGGGVCGGIEGGGGIGVSPGGQTHSKTNSVEISMVAASS